MNIFILNTGRCGSTTFIKACQHISNYSAGHESRGTEIGTSRLVYPDNHIEADNRLSWFLGRVDKQYSDNAFYVHLTRDKNKTAASFIKRADYGIIQAYQQGILQDSGRLLNINDVALDYIDTVTENIKHFLQNKTHKMNFRLENSSEDFKRFWVAINAEGDLSKAQQEWKIAYNAS